MESDSRNNEKGQRSNRRQSSVNLLSDSDVSEPPRVRRSLLFGHEGHRILLAYNWNILPWISLFLWFVFLATQTK